MEEQIITESTSLLAGENIAVILAACIPAVVTIIGFAVTYFLNKRNFKEEVNKTKVNTALDKISELPYKIFVLMELMLQTQKPENYEQIRCKMYQEIVNTTFSYGSKEAIMIVSSMQETRNLLSSDPGEVEKNKTANIAYYAILSCQVKYDLTGIKICPEYWYRMRLPNYKEMKSNLDTETNRIVRELQLQEFLSIK